MEEGAGLVFVNIGLGTSGYTNLSKLSRQHQAYCQEKNGGKSNRDGGQSRV